MRNNRGTTLGGMREMRGVVLERFEDNPLYTRVIVASKLHNLISQLNFILKFWWLNNNILISKIIMALATLQGKEGRLYKSGF